MRIPALFVCFGALVMACGGASSEPAATPTTTSSAAPASSTGPAPSAEADPGQVDGQHAHALVVEGAVLVDVRSPEEYEAKHIDRAINVPMDGIVAHDFGGKDKPLVLYCTAGSRSRRAAVNLRAAGYTHVYLLGPMSAWGQ